MAGRHGVDQGQRRAHSRVAARERRLRLRRRDAARGLGLWVVLWAAIALVAVPAMAWSAYLLLDGRAPALPVVALVAGGCALLMVLLDIRARRRHRRERPSGPADDDAGGSPGGPADSQPPAPASVPTAGRRSHRA